MKVILLQEVDNLGDEGDIVTVKNGYGRNYLIPRGLARLATAGAVKAWQEERRQMSRKLAQRKEDAERLANELGGIEVVVKAKVGQENRIFGTITSQQIADALQGHGVTVSRRKIEMTEEVRHIGVYTAAVKIHPEVVAQVKVRVEPEVGVMPSAPVAATPAEPAAPVGTAESAETAKPAETPVAPEAAAVEADAPAEAAAPAEADEDEASPEAGDDAEETVAAPDDESGDDTPEKAGAGE